MSTIYQFALEQQFDAFVKEQVAAGTFRTADEVIQAGLQLLMEQGEKRSAVRSEFYALVNEGLRQLDSGESIVLHGEEELTEYLHDIGESARARAADKNLP